MTDWRSILPKQTSLGRPSMSEVPAPVQPEPIAQPAPPEPSLADHAASLERRFIAVADGLAPAVRHMLADAVNSVCSDCENGFVGADTAQILSMVEAELAKAEQRRSR